MKLKQISVQIENSHDRLHEFTRALGDEGINLRALTLVDTGNFCGYHGSTKTAENFYGQAALLAQQPDSDVADLKIYIVEEKNEA